MNRKRSGEQIVETTVSELKINKKNKRGLIKSTKSRFPNNDEGREAFFQQLSAEYSTTRQKLFSQIEALEEYAQHIASEEGCKTTSTLDTIETQETIDGIEYKGICRAGEQSEPGSLLYFAYRLEFKAHLVRKRIELFEKSNSDKNVLDQFYASMDTAIELNDDLLLLTIKQNERNIVRGSDDSFVHTDSDGQLGTSTKNQKLAVKRVLQLMQKQGITVYAASKIVAEEVGRDRSTVAGWVKTHANDRMNKKSC